MNKTYSIKGRLIKFLLAPILILVFIDAVGLYKFANKIVSQTYDQELASIVGEIDEYIEKNSTLNIVGLDEVTKKSLLSDKTDQLYYCILDKNGTYLHGDNKFAFNNKKGTGADLRLNFYLSSIDQKDVRVVEKYVGIKVLGKTEYLYILVAETLNKRNSIKGKILAWILLPQFVLIILMIFLILIGIKEGVEPLSVINTELSKKSLNNLDPISLMSVPLELVKLVETLNSLMLNLQQSLEVQNKFIGDAAHQLRTPLAGISAQLELALKSSNLQETKDRVYKSTINTERLISLVNQLLILARNQHDAVTALNLEVFDLTEITRKIFNELNLRAAWKKIDMELILSNIPIFIKGDYSRVHDLIYNILENAIKYTDQHGKVVCEVFKEHGRACLKISDNGKGIAKSDFELIFNRFYRSDDYVEFGSGLGLAIVKEIAILHNATIEVDSKQGEGSFTMFKVNFILLEKD